jgi:hypothetical protein
MGRIGLINSAAAPRRERLRRGRATAVINKRAGGMGLISGRKAFQRPMAEGVKLLNSDPGRLPRQAIPCTRVKDIIASLQFEDTKKYVDRLEKTPPGQWPERCAASGGRQDRQALRGDRLHGLPLHRW